ncbi:MAG TPA: DUF3800 domain-containing protein [Terriglobia bacterium]|nr:DUF3800 domain-containing protein [Terriglobia bacterium]
MAIWHAYFDESGKPHDQPVVTFCGVCGTRQAIDRFDEQWRLLLRRAGMRRLHTTRALRNSVKLGDHIPKQTVDERTDALKPFSDCINDHLEIGLVIASSVKGFQSLSAKAREKLGKTRDPHYVAFVRGMLALGEYIKGNDLINMICDDDMETAWNCYLHWRKLRRFRRFFDAEVISLTFADDEHFPAVQAADMVASLARLEARLRFYGQPYSYKRLFEHLTTERGASKMKWYPCFADEKKFRELGEELDAKAR